jgi:glucokinase
MAPAATFLGIEIGGTKLQLVTGNAAGGIHARWRFEVTRAEGAAGIRRQIEQALPECLAAGNVTGLGVGFGGPVNWRTGQICVSHHVEGWSEFHLADWLSQRTGLPVKVDNDANVAALGEAMRGAGQGCDPVFYSTLGSGVGGGLVVGGAVYHGATPGESELGHVRLDRSGVTVESRCSGWAVDARIRELLSTAPASLLAKLSRESPGHEARHLAPALAAGDAAASELLREVAEDLAFGLSHVAHLFHPQVIVLGGGLSKVGEPLRAAVEAALPRFLMDAFHPGPCLALSALGEDAVPVGALLLAGR